MVDESKPPELPLSDEERRHRQLLIVLNDIAGSLHVIAEAQRFDKGTIGPDDASEHAGYLAEWQQSADEEL